MKNKNTTMLNKLNVALDACINRIADSTLMVIATAVIGPIVFVVGVLAIVVGINYCTGTDGFGPERDEQITVQRLYVDKSNYMVGTDKGVYEVQNFILPIQIFNSDELYSKLEVGKTYNVTLKGNKVLNPFMQQYPYIISIK
jgi:hypothetical protein